MAISDYLELIIENNANADKTPTQTHHTHSQISKAINVCEAKATSATHQIMHNWINSTKKGTQIYHISIALKRI